MKFNRPLCILCWVTAIPLALMLAAITMSARGDETQPKEGRAKEAAEDSKVLDELERLQQANRDRVKSFRGTGTYSTASKDTPDTKTESVRFTVLCKGTRFHLTLHPELVAPGHIRYDKIVAVGDDTNLYSTRYSPRIPPPGCETMVFERDERGLNNFITATHGLHYDVSDLSKMASDLPMARKRYSIKAARLESGDVRGEYDLNPRNHIVFIASPKIGMNISELTLTIPQTGTIDVAFKLQWESKGDVWFVNDFQNTAASEVTRVAFDTYELNPELDDSLFTFAGLAPSAGSRVLDQRAKAVRRVYKESEFPRR